MPPPPQIKPENVLKRAQELVAVQQSSAALTVLHEHVTSKRSRNSPIASLEPVMLQFVQLCVELRKGKLAKDGLYQYKNTAQNTNVGTIELVLKTFIDLAQARVDDARGKAEEIQSEIDASATGKAVEDLEASETPESVLMSTISGEQSKDRTERAVVTPWLKFLWETYRTVLEILKNNSRLESMYQSTANLAFTFCQNFLRKTEFRRLCELLRNHVQNAAKYQTQMNAINLSEPDTLQRHLDTRFQQLNVAVELELWQEAFRSIEDIHTLLSLSKRAPKNMMMANYYEKLTRIFLMSENYLFHAASWNRYYNMLRQFSLASNAAAGAKKESSTVTDTDLTRAASFVLLSALSIPVISTSRSKGAVLDLDEARKTKNNRLTSLLGMSSPPTRAVLFKDAMNKGLLSRVKPEIYELYHLLEVEFHPLSICTRIAPILAKLALDANTAKYIAPLRQVILSRLFQQLSQVYESVTIDFVCNLARFPEGYELSSELIEKFIMNGCKKGDLSIRLDHERGMLTFESDVFAAEKFSAGQIQDVATLSSGPTMSLQKTPSDIVRSQLTRLAKSLFVVCSHLSPISASADQTEKFADASRNAAAEHHETLSRRAIIEKKKELASDALQKKQKEDESRKRLLAQQRQEAENLRLAEEHKERERRRMKEEQDRIRRENNEKELHELTKKGIDVGDLDIKDLDSNQLRILRITQLEKEKNDLNKNLKVTGKRLDHLERAFRREELKLLPEDYENQCLQDRRVYDKSRSEMLRAAERKHKEDVALKDRLGRLVAHYEDFHKDLKERRHDEFEKRRKQADREFQTAVDKRKREHRDRKAREERERKQAEEFAKQESERIAQETARKAVEDEARKRQELEAKTRREEERRIFDEKAARQRKIEDEAEAKRKARLLGQPLGRSLERSALVSRGTDSTTTESTEASLTSGNAPSRISLPGKKMTWREREAQKLTQPSEASIGEPPSAKRTGYLPPAMRDSSGQSSPHDLTSRSKPPANYEPQSAQASPISPNSTKNARSQADLAGDKLPNLSAGTAAKTTTGKWVPPHLRGK